jgi:hypothetical protein
MPYLITLFIVCLLWEGYERWRDMHRDFDPDLSRDARRRQK